MAEDVETPPQEQPPKLSVDQFAEKIKAKYPDYAHIDNKTLTDKILAKYPEYGNHVDLKPVKPIPGVVNQPTNFLPPTPQDDSLTPVLPQNRAQVKQQQIQDAHANAIQTAQQQRQTPKALLADNPDRSMMDRVSQAVYLPALKQGFNDLVIKPLAGATDFVDRTVDKAYTAVTGDKTPDWMRESKGSIFKSVSDQIQKEYDTRDKPKNIVSDVAEGTIGALPLMASLFTGEGEAKLATQAPQFISKATKLFATTGALNAFKDATTQGDDYSTSINKSVTGAEKGAVTGLTLDAQMLAAGALGKGVVNQLAEKGLLKGGKAGEALIHAIATGTIFGGTSAGQDLLDGKDIDTHEAAKQFGIGLAFETIPVAKGLADAAGEHIEKSDVNKKAAQQAATVTAASNLNGEGALRTLMTTPTEQLMAIKDNIPDSHETLYANSVEQGMKAYEEKNVDEKKALYADQLALKTQGDVKLIESKLKDNAPELIQSINESTELQPEQKQDLLQKIDALTPKNEQAEPNQELPVTPQADETASPQETAVPINEATTNNQIIKPTENESTNEKGSEKNGSKETVSKKEDAVSTKEEIVKSGEDKTEPDTIAPERQKAIDAITHGIIGDGQRKQGDTSPRFDLGMNTADQKRAIRDITKGDYETAPAKKMIDKVADFEKNGEYPIIEGQGGASVRNRFATPQDIQQHIDDAKQFKLAKEQDIDANNKGLHDLGITHQDVQDYENYRTAGEPGTADNGRATENTPKDVQRPENDKGASEPQSASSEAAQGEPTARELATQARKEAKAKLDALKSNSGIADDPEKKAKALFEYHKALVNEAKEYIKEGVKSAADFAKSIGEKVDDSITKAWNEATGKTKPIENHKEFAETGQPADTTEPDKEDPSKIYGTKNSVTEALRDGMGMPPIEIPKDRSEDASLNAWKDGTRTPLDIIDGLLDPNTDIYDKAITPNDEPIIREYIKQLGEQGAELNKAKVHLQEHGTPEDVASVTQQLANHYDQMERALNASKIGGNIWHKYGAERQVAVDEQGLVVNSIERIKNIYGNEIPEEVKAELKDLQAKYDNLLAKQAKIEEQVKAGGAKEEFEKAKPKRGLLGTSRAKKTDVEFKKEREDIIEKMRRDFKKSFGQLNATLPGVPQFNAIAPHVTALMKSFAEQGVSKVDDVIVKVHDIVKDVVDGITKDDIRDIIAGKYGDKKPLSDLQKQLNDLRTQARNKAKIEELEKGIVAKTKAKGESSLEVKTLQKQLQELKKQAINQYADLSTEELKKQAKTIQTQIDKGDYFKIPTVKRKWETDPEWVKANKEKAELNFRLRKLEREALDSKKGKFMRALDWGNRWGRRVIFFGANAVYTKLASAAVLGSFIHRIPEQALGKLNAKMFPHIARNAPIEGYTNASAEGKFYSEFLNPVKLVKNTKDILLTGETDLSKELGKQLPHNHIPGIDLFAADAHIMIKDPVKRATFEASLQNHLNWYEKNGIDPTHPLMLESARQAAYKRAEYEIFQNSEQNSNKIKQFFNQLEKTSVINKSKPDIWNKHFKGNAQYTAAAIYHFMIPVNTVPVNILKRIGLGLQLPATYLKAIADNKSVRDGTLNMTSEESDAIMLHLKKGQVSAAYWTLGFVLAGSAAGGLYTSFYSDKERDKTTDVQDADYLNFRGVDISKNVQHNTQFQALQMGATWGIVYNHYIDDGGESQLSAILKASAATAGVAAKEHPVIETASNVLEALKTPHGNTKFVKDLKRRVGVNKAQDVFKMMGYDTGDDDN